jgi:alkylhydroperoxidase family enzyme
MEEATMPRVQPVPIDKLNPRARAMLEAGMANGVYNDNSGQIPPSMRTLAWSTHALEVAHANAMASWEQGLLDAKLKELVRIRSAQVNGCANCASAIKDDGVSSDDVACMIDTDYSAFTPREAAALRYATKFGTDHHSIEDADIQGLLRLFSPAEVVELVHYTASMLGAHRMFSVFKVISDCDPVIRFEPGLVDAPMARAAALAS